MNMESGVGSNNRNATLLVGTIAAAAGLTIAALFWWRMRCANREASDIRSVTEVLNDCYEKMQALQESISQLPEAAEATP